MEELLNLARQLRPTALDDHGLMPAVETQLKRFSARTGVEVSLNAEGDPDTLPEDVQTAVYRILQEALANVGRHAGATAVAVEIEADGERLELRVRDDGEGFDPVALARGSNGDGPGRRARPERDGRARPPGRRRARRALRARRRHDRDAPHRASSRRWPRDPRPDRGRPRHRALGAPHADRAPARHGGGRRGRGRRRGARVDPGAPPDRRGARRVDAADDRAPGRARDPRARARHARADALDARRRALLPRGARGGRRRLRAEAGGRQGPDRRRAHRRRTAAPSSRTRRRRR